MIEGFIQPQNQPTATQQPPKPKPAALDLTARRTSPLSPRAQALLGEPLTMFGDGKQTRSFQHVSDLVAGMVAVMDNDEHLGPFNVGNPGVSFS